MTPSYYRFMGSVVYVFTDSEEYSTVFGCESCTKLELQSLFVGGEDLMGKA